MDKIAQDFAKKDVVFYTVYVREPHAGQARPDYDFSNKRDARNEAERLAHAVEMAKEYGVKRPILIDNFGHDGFQDYLDGGDPNSLVAIDRQGKLALWQRSSDPKKLRKKLDEMTRDHVPASRPADGAALPAPKPGRGNTHPSREPDDRP